MEFTGLLVPYRVNRPLTEQERTQQVETESRVELAASQSAQRDCDELYLS